jgi:hypothetical protein
MSPRRWAKRYAQEVLNHLDPEQVVRELVAMSEGVYCFAPRGRLERIRAGVTEDSCQPGCTTCSGSK